MIIPLKRKYTVSFRGRNKSTHNDNNKSRRRRDTNTDRTPYVYEDHILYIINGKRKWVHR